MGRFGIWGPVALASIATIALANPGTEVRVVDQAGKPVRAATVLTLSGSAVSWTSEKPTENLVLEESKTDKSGVANVTRGEPYPCLLVHDGKSAAWHCGPSAAGASMQMALEEAMALSIRPVDAKGRPVKAAVRLVFGGGACLHAIDSNSSGSVRRFPPLPVSRLNETAHLEVRANGYFVGPYPLPPSLDATADLRLLPTRSVKGRVVGPEGPVSGATVQFANGHLSPPGVVSAEDGRFVLGGIPQGAGRKLLVKAGGFGPTEVTVVEELDDADVGDVVVAPGMTISGRVLEEDGVQVHRAFVAIAKDGERLVAEDTDKQGRFELGPFTDGEYEVTVYLHASEGIAGWRMVGRLADAGDSDLDVVVPSGLRVLLRDDAGEPYFVKDCTIETQVPGREEPWRESFNASGRYSELRMAVHGPPGPYTVTVRVPGHDPVTGTADVDETLHGTVEFRFPR